ncbi:beta-1,4-xylosyltransferase IRX14-like isoform X2 [Euphorbia lathyris]|uniref:beta-1,4-xylosyltransferase IRX14-like isoform X2 n=1 Tax=Euphorbia lathyris TaxID=212925 RepID=UPI0033140C9B
MKLPPSSRNRHSRLSISDLKRECRIPGRDAINWRPKCGLLLWGGADETSLPMAEKSTSMPVQGPTCNASDNLAGWHTFDSLPYEGKSAILIDDRAIMLLQKLEWAGFVLNSRLVCKEAEE